MLPTRETLPTVIQREEKPVSGVPVTTDPNHPSNQPNKVEGGDYQERIAYVRGPEQALVVGAVYRAVNLRADTMSVMRLDHYWTKTAEEWRNVKLSRGYPSPTTYLDKFMQQQANYFFAVNDRTPEKEAIVCGKPEA